MPDVFEVLAKLDQGEGPTADRKHVADALIIQQARHEAVEQRYL